MSCIGCEYVRILKSQIQGMVHTIREQTGQKCDLAYLIKCRDEQIVGLKKTIQSMDQMIREQFEALGKQRRMIQAMRGDRPSETGWTKIAGVPALRVKDEYWVDFKGFCDILNQPASFFSGYGPTVIKFNGLSIVYKEELDQ